MPANIFGQRLHDNGGTMIKGTRQKRGRGVIDNQRNAAFTADFRDLANRKHLQLRVWQGFGIIGTGAGIAGFCKSLRVGRIDKPHLDPLLRQGVFEQVPCAAIEICRADNIVTSRDKVLDGIGTGRLTR